jgi:hypothetical protein
MGYTLALTCLILVSAQVGCAATSQGHPIKSQLIGTWEYITPGEGLRKYAGPLKSALKPYYSPHPDRLVFRHDGTFEATYSGEQLARLRTKIGKPELTNPVSGTYDLVLDWAGIAWITMLPDVPERRVSVTKNQLVLHDFGAAWTSESYRRR